MFEREPDSRQSIPPVTRRSLAPDETKDGRGIWAAAILFLAVAVPVFAHHVKSAEPGAASFIASTDEETVLEQNSAVPVTVAAAPAGPGLGAVVPTSAIAHVDGQPIVFVVDNAVKLLIATPVAIGGEAGGLQHILSGLTPGQIVVAEAKPPLQRMLAQR